MVYRGPPGRMILDRATIQRQCVCCRLAEGRGEVFTRVRGTGLPIWWWRKEKEGVACSRLLPKRIGARGLNDPSLQPPPAASPPVSRFTAIRFLPPLRAFVLSYCLCWLLPPRANVLCLLLSSCKPFLCSSPIRTSIFAQVRNNGYRCNADANTKNTSESL